MRIGGSERRSRSRESNGFLIHQEVNCEQGKESREGQRTRAAFKKTVRVNVNSA
jgi:hypothetical protein